MKNMLIASMVGISLSVGSVAASEPLPAKSPALTANTYLDVARAGTRVVAVGDRGYIVYSDDEGSSWRRAEVPTGVLLTAVCFADARHGWAVGHDAKVLGTRDGGRTWSVQYADALEVAGRRDDDLEDDYDDYDDYDDFDDDLYGDYDDEDGVAEAGAQDTSGAPLLDVICLGRDHAIAVGGYGYMLETKDGGDHWEKVMDRLNNREGWHLNAIAAISGTNTLLAAGEKGLLFRSRDQGLSWQSLKSPYEGSFFGLTPLADGAVLVYGLQGNLWLTRNQGDSWRKIDTGVTRGINQGVQLDDGTIVLVGGAGVVLISRDGGNSVTLQYLRDRESVSSLLPLTGSDMLMVGDSGIRVKQDIR